MPKLRIDSIDLYYEINGQGQPVLFIHGLGSSSRDWEMQVPSFSERYRVVTFDLRGHGKSGKPPGPYRMAQFAADTAGLVRALEIAPAHIVGISLGGMVAFQLAVDAPELVRSLTVINSAPEFIVRTARERFQVLQRKLIVRLLGMRKMGEVLGKRLFVKPEQAELRRVFADRWAENDPRAYREAMLAIPGWSVADRLEAITCPTLVIAADEDYTPVSVKAAFVARMPRAELVVIQDSRHATPVECPEQFNETVTAFLSKQV
ncbi:MAG: alpha/beta fold hydrolase [Chloroflexota bacterium]